jgi:hypothetical protein
MNRKIWIVPIIGLSAAFLSGCCVSNGVKRGQTTPSTAGGSVVAGTGTGGTINSDGSVSNVPTGTATPYSFSISGTGYVSKTVTVSAGKVLRVKFTPGTANQAIAGSGATASYSAMGVYLSAGSSTAQATPLLRNGYYGAAESTIMDLSASLPTACSASTDATCRRTVTVTVSKPNLDYYCLSYGAYCPYSQAPSNVPWNATLTIQTDDTTAL